MRSQTYIRASMLYLLWFLTDCVCVCVRAVSVLVALCFQSHDIELKQIFPSVHSQRPQDRAETFGGAGTQS